MLRNPYLNRAMLRSLDAFHGRTAEIGRVMARVGAWPPQSVSIVGERRVGKSSLLWHLSRPEIYRRYLEEPDAYVFLLIDFQGQQHLDQRGFCRVWGRQLHGALGNDGTIEDLSALEDAVAALGSQGRRLVCLFDEFETIARNADFGAEFFGFLRSLANAHPVAFLTSSRRDLQELCHTRAIAESPFFNIFTRIYLGALLPAQARELIEGPSAAAGRPLAAHADEILRLGGRLPLFLQMACSAAFECLGESETGAWDTPTVETRFLDEAESHFRYIWSTFSEDECRAVAALAAGQAVDAAVLRVVEAAGYVERRDGGSRLFAESFVRFVGRQDVPLPAAPPEAAPAAPVQAAPAPQAVDPVPAGSAPFEGIVGDSVGLRRVFALMQKAAATDVTVLVLGETGTGKEQVARQIHAHSGRASEPFVAVNCGAIAENLLESELFGHRKGAFTGASSDRPGLLEEAAGGTLFLDEIGEVAPAVQVKLLRFLQEGELRRVGENRNRHADVRLVCATNRDLLQEVEEGRFRADFYYRLYALAIRLPPLRQRPGDTALLVRHFLRDYDGGIAPAALRRLQAYAWPGNVRELENQLASARALAGGAAIGAHHLWPHLQEATAEANEAGDGAVVDTGLDLPADLTLREAREFFERDLIAARLARCDWDLDRVAKSLGLSRSRLYELIRRHDLKQELKEESGKQE